MEILTGEMVVLSARAADKADAIRQAGEVLVAAGCVSSPYVDGMLARERVMSTYLGSGIAIPHGEHADLGSVIRTGISVIQIPEGVEWEPGEPVYLVIGIASKSDEHFEALSNLTALLHLPEVVDRLIHTSDPMVIVRQLTCQRSEEGWN